MDWNEGLLEQWLKLYFAPRKLQRLIRQQWQAGVPADWRRPLTEINIFWQKQLPEVCPNTVTKLARWLRDEEHSEKRGLLLFGGPLYPPLLQQIDDPPLLLCYEGSIECLRLPQLAMVGSRNATELSLQLAREFATELAAQGVSVVSGMALGIDSASHRGCLQKALPTVAVLGCGIDQCYPPRARELKQDIIRYGVVLSEYLPGMPVKTEHFPARNRIISGLSYAVIIICARRRSGTLITARLAAEQGRDIFAVPHNVREPEGQGCNQLIQQGAKLVMSAADILVECESWFACEPTNVTASELLQQETQQEMQQEIFATGLAKPEMLANVGFETTPFETFVQRSGLSVSQATNELIELELDGWIKAVAGGYARVRR
ncbi:DNA-processing protein DprA [Aliidiomarina celeris]|uniref:DNA-processing protein DprA n=1 Tax=Aliidiomarina celeris TaxID=2249428 RepID=UPI000DEA6D4A|nr:DNA-processing protein DprA [Aliidiomarina celeris]